MGVEGVWAWHERVAHNVTQRARRENKEGKRMGIRVIIQEKRGKDVKVQAKKNTQAMGFACLAFGFVVLSVPWTGLEPARP